MRHWRTCNRAWLAVAIAAAALWGRPSFCAASYEGQKVALVDVRGAQVTARETVLAKVQTKPGGPYQDQVVSEDIRRIFALGYFTDVKVEVEETPEGLLVAFVVREKPTITAIEIEGNKYLRKQRILQLLGIDKGTLYDPRKVKEGLDAIKAEYARKGYSQPAIETAVDADEARNTATLRMLVDEGPRMRISRILMEGNQAFSDRRLRRLLKTKRRKWFMPGVFNEQVVEEDAERVRAFYRKNGYQDVEVGQRTYRDPSGRGLYIHFTITEGLQHRVGQVALEGAVLFPGREILRTVTLKPGSVYSQEGVQDDLRLIKQYYGDRGYINAEVSPDPQLNAETKRVNLAYRITEHELVYVSRIDIEGNLRTKDLVVRRDLRIYPGEAFDGAKIRKSIERLYNLGYFEEVGVDTEPSQTPNQEALIVRVKEAKTGSFSFGGGFSSVDRLVGLVELEQRNFDIKGWPTFTGAGQDLRLRVEVGTVRRFFDLSFTEPWAFGHPVSLGFDLYNRTRLRERDLGLAFEEERRGGGIRLGKEFKDRVRVSLGYQLFRTEISDVVDEASADLKAEQGRSTTSVVGTGLSFDSRDNRFDPTRGFFAFTSADVAGGIFGADEDFYRMQAGMSSYVPHFDRLVLESRVKTGLVNEYGDNPAVPIFERFFGGGSGTIRGYEERRVGPRDPVSNDPIGGETTLVATLEEVMTLFKDERGRSILKGSAFLDVGDVWQRVGDYGESFKAGVGVGMRVNTPIGPVRLDLGFPLNEIDGEKREPRFHFNISRSF